MNKLISYYEILGVSNDATQNDIKKNEDHPDIEDENCVTCHDPHGNDEQYFLR